ncbi:hypothetical protein BHE74_00000399 [Ensete ventricosum]|nr:hypothetical protein BHE74_00000399 [Ensete ventricosum]
MSLSHTTQGVVPNGTALLGRAAWAKRTNSNNTYRVQKLSAREPLIASTIAYIFLHFLPSSREFTAVEPNFCHAAYLKTKGEERKPAADSWPKSPDNQRWYSISNPDNQRWYSPDNQRLSTSITYHLQHLQSWTP